VKISKKFKKLKIVRKEKRSPIRRYKSEKLSFLPLEKEDRSDLRVN